MSENRCSCNSGGASSGGRDTICIDTYRVFDSCRDKDCYENARVYLNNAGRDVLNRVGSAVRVVCAKILWTYITVDPIQFNRGFYQVSARFYVQVHLQACTGNGRAQEFDGIAVLDKKVVLYGGEGNVSVFRSDPENTSCNACVTAGRTSNLPIAVVETVEPVVLGSTVLEGNDCNCACYSCCSCDEIPTSVCEQCGLDGFANDDGCRLYVLLGLFSVFRIERPAQYLVTATDYCVPDKECACSEPSNPCSLFRNMAFPTGEFCGGSTAVEQNDRCQRR